MQYNNEFSSQWYYDHYSCFLPISSFFPPDHHHLIDVQSWERALSHSWWGHLGLWHQWDHAISDDWTHQEPLSLACQESWSSWKCFLLLGILPLIQNNWGKQNPLWKQQHQPSLFVLNSWPVLWESFLESLSHLSISKEVSSPLLLFFLLFHRNLSGGWKFLKRGGRVQGLLWSACKESAPFCRAAGATEGDGGSRAVLSLTQKTKGNTTSAALVILVTKGWLSWRVLKESQGTGHAHRPSPD